MIDYWPTVPCKFCGVSTPMLGTKQCDNCHEVAIRVRSMPDAVLERILAEERAWCPAPAERHKEQPYNYCLDPTLAGAAPD